MERLNILGRIVLSFVLFSAISLLVMFAGHIEIKAFQHQETPLRIALKPVHSSETQIRAFNPLFTYISRASGISCQVTFPESYEALRLLLNNNEVDIAHSSRLNVLKLPQQESFMLFVMREENLRFKMLSFTQLDSEYQTLRQFQVHRFSFGSSLSTSSHLIQRSFLEQKNVLSQKYISGASCSECHRHSSKCDRRYVVDRMKMKSRDYV